MRWPRTTWPINGAAKQQTDCSFFVQHLALCHFILVKKTYSTYLQWNVRLCTECSCSCSEMHSQGPECQKKSAWFCYFIFSLWRVEQQCAWFSSSQQKLQLHELFFCEWEFAISILPPRMLKTNHDTAGRPRESWGKHNLTYLCAEFNLQNTTVQVGEWLRVKGTYLCSSWQLGIFNVHRGTAADFLFRISGPASICLEETLFFQIHEYHILEASKWPFESSSVASFQGKAAFPVTEGRFTIQLSERIAFPFLSPICSV